MEAHPKSLLFRSEPFSQPIKRQCFYFVPCIFLSASPHCSSSSALNRQGIFLQPFRRLVELLETPLVIAEFAVMRYFSPVDQTLRMFDVQHLVIKHKFDNIAWSFQAVERTADDDGAVNAIVMP